MRLLLYNIGYTPHIMWWKVGIGITVVGALGWFGWSVTRPVPGTKIADQGREHVSPQAVAEFKFTSNPPTSGSHLPTWVRAGIFATPQSEGELIHALEHGYIIISYNCNIHLSVNSKSQASNSKQIQNSKFQILNVYAHEEEGSPSADFIDPTVSTGSPSTSLRTSATNETDGCKTLVKNLTELGNRKKVWKLAIVPRPQLDTTIALTAWNYIDKFDGFDASRIERFIDYHRDQGPEKTME